MDISIRTDKVVKYTNNGRNVDLLVDERPKGNAILHPNFIAIANRLRFSPQPMNLNGKGYGKRKSAWNVLDMSNLSH